MHVLRARGAAGSKVDSLARDKRLTLQKTLPPEKNTLESQIGCKMKLRKNGLSPSTIHHAAVWAEKSTGVERLASNLPRQRRDRIREKRGLLAVHAQRANAQQISSINVLEEYLFVNV